MRLKVFNNQGRQKNDDEQRKFKIDERGREMGVVISSLSYSSY